MADDPRAVAVGNAIREARLPRSQGWLVEELNKAFAAKKITGQSITQSGVSRWEAGQNIPRGRKLAVIEEVLDLPPGQLRALLNPDLIPYIGRSEELEEADAEVEAFATQVAVEDLARRFSRLEESSQRMEALVQQILDRLGPG